jgi:hypothetical protein
MRHHAAWEVHKLNKFENSAASFFEVEVTYTLKMEAASSFGTLVLIRQSTRRQILDDHILMYFDLVLTYEKLLMAA